MTATNGPIITSLLDLDLYKISMLQLTWRKFPNAEAEFALTNRSSVNLLDYIDMGELKEQIAHVAGLRFTPRERAYLAANGFDDTNFQRYLKYYRLSPIAVDVKNGLLDIRPRGSWPEASLWETLILSIVAELSTRGQARAAGLTETQLLQTSRARLTSKIELLRRYPELQMIEFGTRRRLSGAWQTELTEALMTGLHPGQLMGTSNILRAMELGLQPKGTYAHEVVMGYAALYRDLETGVPIGQKELMRDWWALYGPSRSIALMDTFGSRAFFKDFREFAAQWNGGRQDSGDPVAVGNLAIQYYRELGLDPKTKVLLFSDGLDTQAMIRLHQQFHQQIQDAYGPGTHNSHDCEIPPMPLVVKLVRINGIWTLKLTENISKAMGRPADIERARAVYKHTSDYNVPCTV